MPIGHGNLFWLVLESHGKVMEIDFAKRVVTLTTFILLCMAPLELRMRGTIANPDDMMMMMKSSDKN